MKKFNNSDLFTGYLKQLLHNFNLPKIKVYTKEHQKYAETHNGEESPEILSTVKADLTDYTTNSQTTASKNIRYFPYIKNGEIQEYINGEWVNLSKKNLYWAPATYNYGTKILNYTKNLKINSNIYDSYTHEYLGDYLRFQRDFLGLNLMSMYNCFSNRACDKLKLKWNINSAIDNATVTINFDTADTNYKIYMLPVKLFKKYTIAIDSEYPIEMCCGLYGDYQDTRTKFNDIPKYTYKRVTHSQFSQPFIYDLLAYTNDNTTNTLLESLDSNPNDTTKIELAQNECDLKLFIKLPVNNNSTIVVLEGDYLNWNDSYWDLNTKKSINKSVINIEHYEELADKVKLISPLQLLNLNTSEQHPFADKLIEYLIGNTITNSEEEISANISRAQKALQSNYDANKYIAKLPGFWSSDMNVLFYEFMTNNNKTRTFETSRDILGYVDKEVEKYYNAIDRDPKTGLKTTISLSNIELSEEDL